jgi:hypothetical protein
MLAHGFLVVAAVTEHGQRPARGAVELACNEIQHLFAALVAIPVADRATGCAGRGGDVSARPALVPGTTADKPPSNHEGHDIRVEYQAPGALAAARPIGRSAGRARHRVLQGRLDH